MTKKEYKKAKRRATRPFKGLAIATGIISVFVIGGSTLVSVLDNSMAIFTNGSFWKLKNPDNSFAQYASDFDTQEEKYAYEKKIAYNLEAEGATLLKNDNNALPLSANNKVSLFSTGSVDIVYGGTGSGSVDASKAPDLKTALEKSGLKVNGTLWDYYKNSKVKRVTPSMVTTSGAKVGEVPYKDFSNDVIDSFNEYGDAAIMTLGRIGGEGADLTFKDENYLALDDNELDVLKNLTRLKKEGKFKKIIVLLNSSNTIQLDFLKNSEIDVDSVLWIGGVGQEGLYAVGDILVGEVNPSGSLPDTYLYDNYSSPAMKNMEVQKYNASGLNGNNSKYFVYQEGIYVGYKYYETRYFDYVDGRENVGDYDYSNDVAYSFGYGNSYTDFTYSEFDVSYSNATDTYFVDVKVTNTGSVKGKNAVKIFAQTPYGEHEINNGVEKSAVQLVGFSKTPIMQPGESRVITVPVERRELASYDANDLKTYYISEGTHYFTVANGAHEAANNILSLKNTSNPKMDGVGNKNLAYAFDLELDATTYSKSKNGTTITNQFDSADINKFDGETNKIKYVSRSNWTSTMPKGVQTITPTEKILDGLKKTLYSSKDYEKEVMPKLKQKGNLTLFDLKDKDIDDPMWDELLSQMSFEEMLSLTTDSFHFTMPIKSINAPGTRDENGPQGLTMKLFKSGVEAMAFTSEDVMAATLNKDLMYEVGKCIGMDCLDAEISFLYGPGNNIHRTPYGGRNFEYYSEDGFLSGAICTPEVRGIQKYGVGVMMKHFVLNDSEQARLGQGVWINEQALREVYLKAYQAPVEEANANGIMAAYTRLGTTWSGASKALMTNVLRNEWGCKGMLITDNNLSDFMDPCDAMLAGITTYDAMLPLAQNSLKKYKNDPVIVNAMKEACKYNLYAIANSNAMNNVGPNTKVIPTTPSIVVTMKVAESISITVFAIFLGLTIYKLIKFKKNKIEIEA